MSCTIIRIQLYCLIDRLQRLLQAFLVARPQAEEGLLAVGDPHLAGRDRAIRGAPEPRLPRAEAAAANPVSPKGGAVNARLDAVLNPAGRRNVAASRVLEKVVVLNPRPALDLPLRALAYETVPGGHPRVIFTSFGCLRSTRRTTRCISATSISSGSPERWALHRHLHCRFSSAARDQPAIPLAGPLRIELCRR